MAVTITRSTWVDDDGTGTTGTVINQALHTTLYNEIDTALAKLGQLAGGNTWTGLQTFGGGTRFNTDVYFNTGAPQAGCIQTMVVDAGSRNGIAIQNTSATTLGVLFLACINSAGAMQGNVAGATATTVAFNTTSDARLKDDAGRASDLAALRAVVVHDFTWKADGTRARGVFAQEAAAVFPRAITAGTDARADDGSLAHPWMTDYSKFVPDLIVGWQQHEAALAALRDALENRRHQLEGEQGDHDRAEGHADPDDDGPGDAFHAGLV